MNEFLRALFQESIKKWGVPSQVLMLAEECNELSVASFHMLRASKTKTQKDYEKAIENFAEEICDVEFMIEEMIFYFHLAPKVAKYRCIKESRLAKRINKDCV